MAPLRYAAKLDPFLSLDCARVDIPVFHLPPKQIYITNGFGCYIFFVQHLFVTLHYSPYQILLLPPCDKNRIL